MCGAGADGDQLGMQGQGTIEIAGEAEEFGCALMMGGEALSGGRGLDGPTPGED